MGGRFWHVARVTELLRNKMKDALRGGDTMFFRVSRFFVKWPFVVLEMREVNYCLLYACQTVPYSEGPLQLGHCIMCNQPFEESSAQVCHDGENATW